MSPVRVRLQRFERPLKEPFRTGSRVYPTRSGVHLVLEKSGRLFLGEASPLPRFSRETAEEAAQELERSLPAVEKLAAFLPPVPPMLEQIERLLACASARFAAETALLALAAHEAGLSVARLLSKETREEVPVNCVLPISNRKKSQRQIAAALAMGITCFKVKIGPDEKQNVGLLSWIRKELPKTTGLRADANGCWSEGEALRHLQALAPFDLEYAEQPLPAGTPPATIKNLREKSPVPLALDESADSLESIARFLEEKTCALFVLKPAVLGGVASTMKAAQLIEKRGGETVLSSALDGAVGRRINFEIACALPLCARPAGLWTGNFSASESENDALELKGGRLRRRPENLQEPHRAFDTAV